MKVYHNHFLPLTLAILVASVLTLSPPVFAADDSADSETLADLLAQQMKDHREGLAPDAVIEDGEPGDTDEDIGNDEADTAQIGMKPDDTKILFDDELEGSSSDLGFDPDSMDLSGQDLSKLPCLSVGSCSRGRLVNGVKLTSSPGLQARSGDYTYGTPETIAALRYAVAKVAQKYPGAMELVIGDLSRENGGRLKRHKSHQSGRDVDVSYYYKNGVQPQFFQDTSAKNLDVKRTWAFLEALMEENKTEYIFIDRSIQRVLHTYVKYRLKAPESYLDLVFGVTGNKHALIQHARGHRNHMHVRFWSPIAVASAQNFRFRDTALAKAQSGVKGSYREKAYVSLDKLDKVDYGSPPATQTVQEFKKVRVSYRVRSGDTLGSIARRNGVKTSALAKWNGISSKTSLKPGRSLTIYKQKAVTVEVPVVLPEADIDTTVVTTSDTAGADLKTASIPVTPVIPTAESKRTAEPRTIERVKWTTVKKGDNLWSIAKSAKTSPENLCRMNNITKKTKLQVGQKLKVKVWTETVTDSPASGADDASDVTVLETAPNLSSSQPNATPETKTVLVVQPPEMRSFWYKVMEGDSVYTIATRFGVKISDFCQWNRLTPDSHLAKGQNLIIYIEQESPKKTGEKLVGVPAGYTSNLN